MIGKYTQEIAIRDEDRAKTNVFNALKDHYVVQLSMEGDLFIINYEDTSEWGEANRNGTVFMSQEEFDMKYMEIEDERDNRTDSSRMSDSSDNNISIER